jgi:general stress protein 26
MNLFQQSDGGENAADQLWSLLGDHNIFMLTTLTHGDRMPSMRARPMAGYPKRDEHRIWFLAHREGLKDNEIEQDSRVCVTLADADKQHFVSLTGHAAIVDDVGRKQDLWTIAAQAWFPQGPHADDVLLIRVDLDDAEFWDGEANSIVLGVQMATAVAKGEQVEGGDNKKVSLSGPSHVLATGEQPR